ncbi:MAG: SusC/RagA family TonB-linked outer membrane protein [Bacteroidales bacterium]|nr:SusC/RagA family TonB-linked outer membrane protein [Bacteroidales bacterium]
MKKYCLIICSMFFLVYTGLGQDQVSVSGLVLGAGGQPVKDVSVSIEGVGTQPEFTDEEGKFIIDTPSGEVWLIINPVRQYKSKRIFLNNRKDLTIYLSETGVKSGYDDVILLNNSIKRRDVLSAFTDMDLNRIEENNFVTINQMLQGRVPGMMINESSGMPGQAAFSSIRGIGSVNTSNAPLVVVDGIPFERPGLFISGMAGNTYNPLTTIDPSDISSIYILRDPVVTSLYGTRASNGVILIETLEASATQTTINVSFKTGFSLTPSRLIPQLNSEQYKVLANEVLMSSPNNLETFRDDYPGLYAEPDDDEYYRYMHNTNWQDLIFSNALMTNAYMSIKGGSEIATYGLSVGYHDEDGIFKNTRYNRYNVGFVSDLNVFSWFRMNINAYLTNNNSYLRESMLSPQVSPLATSLFKPPIMFPYQYDDEGQELLSLDNVDELGTSNPVAVVNNFMGDNKNYRFISSIKGRADIAEKLNFTTLLGINFNALKEFIFRPNLGMERYLDGEVQNVARATNNHFFSFYSDNFFQYSDQIGAAHYISSSVGLRVQNNTFEADYGEAYNLPENDQYTSLQSGQNDMKNIGGMNERWNWMSLYHHLVYKYQDKYIFNSSLSGDFSTRTGHEAETALRISGVPFGLFYSLGGGWRISEEGFLKSVDRLDNLLLRASYGITGNDDIGSVSARDYYAVSLYRETSGLIPSVIANKFLKYEVIGQLNLGLDISSFGDRTALSVNYFRKTTDDMLIQDPLESYLGYDSRLANLGKVENRGWEIALFYRLVDGENFKWDLMADFTTLHNEVTDLEDKELITDFPGGSFITREGDPVNSFYGFSYEGVYSTQEKAVLAGLVNERGIPYGAGDAVYKDYSGPDSEPDGIIDDYDKVSLGSPVPDYFGDISSNFRYKRWSVNILFSFVSGNEVFNYTRYLNERMVDLSNQSTYVLNRWQSEGDVTSVPRALWNDPIGNSDFSSRWIEDGSHIRLKSLTLRYSIPGNFLVFKNADFYVTAINLFTLDRYLGYDPEFSYSYDPMMQGIDYGQMPQSRRFVAGIRFGL